jgi:hypothetical protein
VFLDSSLFPLYDFYTIYDALMINSKSYISINDMEASVLVSRPGVKPLTDVISREDLLTYQSHFVINRFHSQSLFKIKEQMEKFWNYFPEILRPENLVIWSTLKQLGELQEIQNLCLVYESP